MGTFLKYSREVDSGSWQNDYSLSDAVADNLVNVHAKKSVDRNGVKKEVVYGDYVGTSAITLSDYASLPLHSEIRDFQANRTLIKIAASGTATFKAIVWTDPA